MEAYHSFGAGRIGVHSYLHGMMDFHLYLFASGCVSAEDGKCLKCEFGILSKIKLNYIDARLPHSDLLLVVCNKVLCVDICVIDRQHSFAISWLVLYLSVFSWELSPFSHFYDVCFLTHIIYICWIGSWFPSFRVLKMLEILHL